MRKIGFFGGTFDPIHFGHINLAIELFEIHGLDEVIVCPAARSPFKKSQASIASMQHRMAMTQLAILDIPAFRLSCDELERPGISYTIDTLRVIKENLGAQDQLYILLSEDAVESFHLWKNFEEILRVARPLIGSRGGGKPHIPPSPVREKLLKGLTPTTQLEISSTEIRRRLKKGLYCGHLVPAKVLDYIGKMQLYS